MTTNRWSCRNTLFFCILAAGIFPGLSGWNVKAQAVESPNDLSVAVGKSVLVASDKPIDKVAVGFGDIAEATAMSPTEVLVNAKAPGSTSLIIWQQGGGKLFFDVNVLPNKFLSDSRLETVRREVRTELAGQQINVTAEGDSVFLRGTAKDLTSAERAVSIASTMGKVVNLLYVEVPAPEAQILLKVRFASLDRSLAKQLGVNLFSTGAGRTLGTISTGQFAGPSLPDNPLQSNPATPFVFSDLLNIFLYRKDINLGATIKALETKGVLQVLAEPNVLTENGKQGSFLAGGEFPIPVVQGGTVGANVAITILFREFGVRLNFIPVITPRGTIHLQVAPEVSSLDFGNALTINGFSIPSLVTRKVKSEVELEEGQSFAIGGLLDKRVTDTFEKVPFIGDIPILGKFFQTKNVNRQNTELLVIVTPELVRPIPASAAQMELPFPEPFLHSSDASAIRNPVTPKSEANRPPAAKTMPVEAYIQSLRPEQTLDVSGSVGGKTPGSPPSPQTQPSPSPLGAPVITPQPQ